MQIFCCPFQNGVPQQHTIVAIWIIQRLCLIHLASFDPCWEGHVFGKDISSEICQQVEVGRDINGCNQIERTLIKHQGINRCIVDKCCTFEVFVEKYIQRVASWKSAICSHQERLYHKMRAGKMCQWWLIECINRLENCFCDVPFYPVVWKNDLTTSVVWNDLDTHGSQVAIPDNLFKKSDCSICVLIRCPG